MLVFLIPLVVAGGVFGTGFLVKGGTITIAGAFMERRLRDAVQAARSGNYFDPAQLEDGTLIAGAVPNGDKDLQVLLTEDEWAELAASSPVVPEEARTPFNRYEELMGIGMTRAGMALQD